MEKLPVRFVLPRFLKSIVKFCWKKLGATVRNEKESITPLTISSTLNETMPDARDVTLQTMNL